MNRLRFASAGLVLATMVGAPTELRGAAPLANREGCPADTKSEVFCIYKFQAICFGEGIEEPLFSFCDFTSPGCVIQAGPSHGAPKRGRGLEDQGFGERQSIGAASYKQTVPVSNQKGRAICAVT